MYIWSLEEIYQHYRYLFEMACDSLLLNTLETMDQLFYGERDRPLSEKESE